MNGDDLRRKIPTKWLFNSWKMEDHHPLKHTPIMYRLYVHALHTHTHTPHYRNQHMQACFGEK